MEKVEKWHFTQFFWKKVLRIIFSSVSLVEMKKNSRNFIVCYYSMVCHGKWPQNNFFNFVKKMWVVLFTPPTCFFRFSLPFLSKNFFWLLYEQDYMFFFRFKSFSTKNLGGPIYPTMFDIADISVIFHKIQPKKHKHD